MDNPLIDDCIRELQAIALRLDRAGMSRAALRVSEALDTLRPATPLQPDDIDLAAAAILPVQKRIGSG